MKWGLSHLEADFKRNSEIRYLCKWFNADSLWVPTVCRPEVRQLFRYSKTCFLLTDIRYASFRCASQELEWIYDCWPGAGQGAVQNFLNQWDYCSELIENPLPIKAQEVWNARIKEEERSAPLSLLAGCTFAHKADKIKCHLRFLGSC